MFKRKRRSRSRRRRNDFLFVLKGLKDHTIHFACLSLIYSIFIHYVTDNHFPKDKTVFQLS
ncbi:hypothetical protein LDENG_00246930 [Lucifuga dentata]|nr:hypothetical protein LDENG_00246930 [Lucifuga dentata]